MVSNKGGLSQSLVRAIKGIILFVQGNVQKLLGSAEVDAGASFSQSSQETTPRRPTVQRSMRPAGQSGPVNEGRMPVRPASPPEPDTAQHTKQQLLKMGIDLDALSPQQHDKSCRSEFSMQC